MNRVLSPRELLPRAAKGAARVLQVVVPSGNMRNTLRAKAFGLRPHLPVEFLVESGDVVVQVGTPHPRTIERLARAAGAKGRVTVLEAELKNYQLLSDHAAILNAKGFNLRVINIAAGEVAGSTTLRVSTGKPGDHTIASEEIRMDNDERVEAIEWTEQVVEVAPLDALDLGAPSVVVVTTNGSEFEVLKGAQSLLQSMAPGARVFSKAHARLGDGNALAVPIMAFLDERGFICTRTAASSSVSAAADWKLRDGDVFAFKQG